MPKRKALFDESHLIQAQLGLFALITAVLTGLVREHVLLVAALVQKQHSVAGHMLAHHAFDHDLWHVVLHPAQRTLQSHLLIATDHEHTRAALVADGMTSRPSTSLVLAVGHGTDTSATAIGVVVRVAARA